MNLTSLTTASPSGNQTHEETAEPWPTLVLIGSCIIGSATSLINLWIALSIISCRQLHSVSNALLASLSTSEFLTGIQCILGGFLSSTLSTERPKQFIGLFGAFVYFCNCSFIMNSAAIAADRYLKVSRPMRYIRLASSKRCAFIITTVWLISGIVGSVILTSVMVFIIDDDTTIQIFYDGNSKVSYTCICLIDIVAIPCDVAIFCLMVALTSIARQQQRKVQQERQLVTHLQEIRPQMDNDSAPNPPIRQHLGRPQHKITIYFIINFFTFVATWIPVYVVIHIAVLTQPDTQTFTLLGGVFVVIALGQMFLGTVLLTYTQREHRQVLWKAWQAIKQKFTGK